MPTIIDSLIVELSLDTKKLTEGQREAVEGLRKLEKAADQHVKPVEQHFDKLLYSFKELQGRLLGIGALIAGGLGFNKLVQDTTNLTSATARLAESIGLSNQELTAWEKVGRTVGATSEEIAGSLTSLSRQLGEFKATGNSPLLAFMGQVDINRSGGPTDLMLRLSEWYAKQPDKGFASNLLSSRAGLSQGAINTIALGPAELQKRLREAGALGADPEQVEKLKNLQKAFGDLLNVMDKVATNIVSSLAPALERALKIITDGVKSALGFGATGPGGADALEQQTGGELSGTRSLAGRVRRWWRGDKSAFSGDKTSSNPAGTPNQQSGASAPSTPTTPNQQSGASAPSTPTEGGSAFLSQQRQSFATQLSDPGVRQRVAAMATLEGDRDPVPVIESLANRFGYVNEQRAAQGLPPLSVDQMLTGGFYGPINRGGLPGAVNRLNNDPQLAAKMERATAAVLGGSNTIGGFTDQGLPTDPNGWRTPRIPRGGNVFNDWNGGPGGFQAAAAYRQKLQAGIAIERATAGSTSLPSWLPGATRGLGAPGGTFDDLWRDRIGPLGGAKSSLLRGGTTNNNNNTSNTQIGTMNVTVPRGADPSNYADSISKRLSEYNNVQNANTGLV